MAQRTMGVDLGIQSPSVAVVVDERGRVLVDGVGFELSVEELERVERMALKGTPAGMTLHVVMERTFPTCEYVSAFFMRRGHRVSFAKPDQVKEFRKAVSRKVKTDRRDAYVMARLPDWDASKFSQSIMPSRHAGILKTLLSQRDSMVKQLVFLKTLAIRSANTVWPGLSRVFGDLDSAHARALLQQLEPSGVLKLGEEGLARFLKQHGRIEKVRAEQLAHHLLAVANRAIGLHELLKQDELIELHQVHTIQLLEQITALETQLQLKEKQMQVAYREADPEQHVLSIPGIGDKTGPRFFSYFGEPERFPTTRKAQGFVGMYPQTIESGTSRQKGTALSKEGPAMLRRDLYLVTDQFRRLDPDGARLYYDQMVHKGKHHTSALCVVANRMVIPRIRAVIRDKRPYELRDFEGNPIDKKRARQIVARFYVPEQVRARLRNRKRPSAKKNRDSGPHVTSELEAPRNGPVPRQPDSTKERLSLTKAQLAMLVYRNVDRLLNSGASLEEIRFQLHAEAEIYFEKRG